MSGKARVNVDDGLDDIRWTRPWFRGREVARGVLRSSPKPEKKVLRSIFYVIGEGSRFFRLFSKQQRQNVFAPDAWPTTATCHRPFVNSAVRGLALDALSVRAAVVCASLLLYAGWRQHTGCAALRLLAVETRQHPLLLPILGSKGASMPQMANEIVVATLFLSWSHVGYIDDFLCFCVLADDGSLSCSPAIHHLNSCN